MKICLFHRLLVVNWELWYGWFSKQIVHVEDIAARKANYVEIPEELSNNVISALKCIGVEKLYSHQVWLIFMLLFNKAYINLISL